MTTARLRKPGPGTGHPVNKPAEDTIVTTDQLPGSVASLRSLTGRGNERDRPRGRLLTMGSGALRDSELLALCLGQGSAGCAATEIARRLLLRFGSIGQVLRARPEQLLAEKGLGRARVAAIKSVTALAERALVEQVEAAPVLHSADAVKQLLMLRLDRQERELFSALFLDTRHRLLSYEVLFAGTIDSASVYPREILRRCLALNAAAIILAHNHPSGLAEPSVADIALTERLQPLLAEVGVRLLDHVVVGRGQTVSMAERGLI